MSVQFLCTPGFVNKLEYNFQVSELSCCFYSHSLEMKLLWHVLVIRGCRESLRSIETHANISSKK